MGLEEEAPPLPPRNYSWSDMEDNDDELFQSDDDLDDTSAPVTISDHQKIYSSVSALSTLITSEWKLFAGTLFCDLGIKHTLHVLVISRAYKESISPW